MESRVKLLVLIASDRLHSHTHVSKQCLHGDSSEDICVRLVLMEMKKGLKRGADVSSGGNEEEKSTQEAVKLCPFDFCTAAKVLKACRLEWYVNATCCFATSKSSAQPLHSAGSLGCHSLCDNKEPWHAGQKYDMYAGLRSNTRCLHCNKTLSNARSFRCCPAAGMELCQWGGSHPWGNHLSKREFIDDFVL